jgi:hypothetical protein
VGAKLSLGQEFGRGFSRAGGNDRTGSVAADWANWGKSRQGAQGPLRRFRGLLPLDRNQPRNLSRTDFQLSRLAALFLRLSEVVQDRARDNPKLALESGAFPPTQATRHLVRGDLYRPPIQGPSVGCDDSPLHLGTGEDFEPYEMVYFKLF